LSSSFTSTTSALRESYGDRILDRHDLLATRLDGFALVVDKRDLARDDIEVRVFFGLVVLLELRNELVDLRVKIGAGFGRP